MGERLEKLFTLTDIENLDGAPVTIEAGGLIKDNKTGRVIARMYLKNCSDRPLNSVLVGFKPKGEGGRTISGMRDYLYNASGVPVGEIFGDQTGILFDNNETRSFSADVEEVDFEDGEYWDAAEAKRKAEELKLIVPEEKKREEVPEMWEKPVDKAAAPAVWESEEHSDEPHSADIYGAAIVKQKMEESDDGDFMPASMETRQLQHEERPALEEQTDAYRQEQEKAVINLEGPAEEQPAIELGGPVVAEEQPEEAPEEGAEAIQEEPEITAEPVIEPAVEETEPAEEEVPEEAAEVEAEPEAAEESEQEAAAEEEEPEPAAAEEPAAEEEPETETAPEEESVEAGPVRLADMYGGAANASVLATYAAQYGRQFEQAEVIQPEPAIQAEPEPVEIPAEAAPEEVTEAEPEDLAPEVETAEEAAAETAVPESEAHAVEPEAEPEPEHAAPTAEPEAEPELEEAAPAVEPEAEPEPEEAAPAVEPETQKTEESDQWAGYSAAYPSIFPGQKHEPESTAEPGVQEAAGTEPAAPEAETAEPQPEAAEQPNAEPEPATAEEHIPSIEDTIELPKAAAPEKGPEEAAQILSALENAAGNEAAEPKAAEAAALEADTEAPEASEPAAAAPETAQEAETTAPAAEAEAAPEAKTTAEAAETAEEVRPAQQQKADVVFAAENEVIPSIIDDSKEKALTGEDHSGRNLLNIIVFGGIALIILLVLLIKM